MYELLIGVGTALFPHEDLRAAWHHTKNRNFPLYSWRQRFLAFLLRVADASGQLNHLLHAYVRSKPIARLDAPPNRVYDRNPLNLRLNRIYDMPEVFVDDTRSPCVNVLVPAFDFRSVSAGFFGVFQVALFIRRMGYNVRLVMFDNFYFDRDEFRRQFREYPGLETLVDDLEVEYIGEREAPLCVSPTDISVATVWYSAYFARKIAESNGASRFLYLIQDYEAQFYAGSSQFSLADGSYGFEYAALFSSQSLRNYFVDRDIGGVAGRKVPEMFFNNACASHLPDKREFLTLSKRTSKRRLVFYSRPVVDRNMFELTALVLIEAVAQGVFDPDEWEFIGMGLGEGVVQLRPDVVTTSLPRMTLKAYLETVSSFDVCLTLMASPHPSMIPMDLAKSGAVVVTNTFGTKTEDYLQGLSENIISAAPNLSDLVLALRRAVELSKDVDRRYENAVSSTYPGTWEETFTSEHAAFLRSIFGAPPSAPAIDGEPTDRAHQQQAK